MTIVIIKKKLLVSEIQKQFNIVAFPKQLLLCLQSLNNEGKNNCDVISQKRDVSRIVTMGCETQTVNNAKMQIK